MIDKQRNHHFWIWAILGPLTVALLIGALLYRQAPAVSDGAGVPASSAPDQKAGQP